MGLVLNSHAAPYLLNETVDASGDFHDFADNIFTADKLGGFDPATPSGQVCLLLDNQLLPVTLRKTGVGWKLDRDPLAGKVQWKISAH